MGYCPICQKTGDEYHGASEGMDSILDEWDAHPSCLLANPTIDETIDELEAKAKQGDGEPLENYNFPKHVIQLRREGKLNDGGHGTGRKRSKK